MDDRRWTIEMDDRPCPSTTPTPYDPACRRFDGESSAAGTSRSEKRSRPAKGDGSALVAVMRRDQAQAEDYARRHGVPRVNGVRQALFADPEVHAVYIATPPSSHCDLAFEVAAAGKPVWSRSRWR